jgi:hypothetical protein
VTRFLRESCARLAGLAVGLLLLSGVVMPGVATAATTHCPKSRVTYSPSNGATSQFGWLLQPGTHTTAQRSWLIYNVTGGKVLCDSVALSNPSKHAVTVRLYPADAYNTSDGGFAFTAFKDKLKGVGTWVKLPFTKLTVPSGKTADIPIVVTVPKNATPGDIAGGVVAQDTKVSQGKSVGNARVGVRAGVGVRLYAKVAGLLHPQLSLTKLTLQPQGGFSTRLFGAGSAIVSYQIGNTGNVRLAVQSGGEVTTSTKTFPLAKHQFAELLPGTQPVAVKEKVTGLRWGSLTGRIGAKVTVTAAGAAPVTLEATAWQVPWLGLLAMAVPLALIAALWVRRRRGSTDRDPADAELISDEELEPVGA